LKCLIAIQIGEGDIEDGDVGLLLANAFEGGGAVVGGFDDVKTKPIEEHGESLGGVVVVVGDDDAQRTAMGAAHASALGLAEAALEETR